MPINSVENHCKTGIVAIVGRPSVGKSTFLNTASKEKISIISAVPQTTRNAIRGIINGDKGQLVCIDTPGYHDSEKKMNQKMKNITKQTLLESDVILYIIDVSRKFGEEETQLTQLLLPLIAKTVIALNKIDEAPQNLPAVESFLQTCFPLLPNSRIVPISAKNNTNIDTLLSALFELTPEAPPLYPQDYYTDQSVDFRIAEIIRENAINCTFDEIPHAIYVEIADMEWRKNGKTLWVRAFLIADRESQKGMLIGKDAQVIKHIRVESIKNLRKIFDYRVDLDLQVKVHKNWRQHDPILEKLIN